MPACCVVGRCVLQSERWAFPLFCQSSGISVGWQGTKVTPLCWLQMNHSRFTAVSYRNTSPWSQGFCHEHCWNDRVRKGFIPSACIKDKSKESRRKDGKRTYDFFSPKRIRSRHPDECHGSYHSVCDLTEWVFFLKALLKFPLLQAGAHHPKQPEQKQHSSKNPFCRIFGLLIWLFIF